MRTTTPCYLPPELTTRVWSSDWVDPWCVSTPDDPKLGGTLARTSRLASYAKD